MFRKPVKSLLAALLIASLGALALGYTSNIRGIARVIPSALSSYEAVDSGSVSGCMAFGDTDGCLADGDDPPVGCPAAPEHFEQFTLSPFDFSGGKDSSRIGGSAPLSNRSPSLFVPSTPKALTMHITGRERFSLAKVLLPSPRSPPPPARITPRVVFKS